MEILWRYPFFVVESCDLFCDHQRLVCPVHLSEECKSYRQCLKFLNITLQHFRIYRNNIDIYNHDSVHNRACYFELLYNL